MFLYLNQIFIFLLGHLLFFLHFFFTFMENLFKKHPISYNMTKPVYTHHSHGALKQTRIGTKYLTPRSFVHSLARSLTHSLASGLVGKSVLNLSAPNHPHAPNAAPTLYGVSSYSTRNILSCEMQILRSPSVNS